MLQCVKTTCHHSYRKTFVPSVFCWISEQQDYLTAVQSHSTLGILHRRLKSGVGHGNQQQSDIEIIKAVLFQAFHLSPTDLKAENRYTQMRKDPKKVLEKSKKQTLIRINQLVEEV